MNPTQYIFAAGFWHEHADRDGERVTIVRRWGAQTGPPSPRYQYRIRFGDGMEINVAGKHLRSLTISDRDAERPLLHEEEENRDD